LDVYEVENSFTVSALCARIANVAHLQQFAATSFGCSLEKLNFWLRIWFWKILSHLLFSIGGFQILISIKKQSSSSQKCQTAVITLANYYC